RGLYRPPGQSDEGETHHTAGRNPLRAAVKDCIRIHGGGTMQFAECVMQRYATKKFDGRTLPEAKVNELLELVRFAPSALNLQPWKIKLVPDKATREALRPVSNDQEQITTCSHLLVFCADADYDSLIRRLGELMKKNHVPDEIIKMVTGMAAGFVAGMSKEQRAAWSQAQTYLALGNA